MRAKLTHNLGLKVWSLLLACLLWFLVAQIGNPKDTKSFSNIPVTLTNTQLLEDKNKVFQVLNETDVVRVTVSAPRSIMANLRSSDIIAEADMSKLTDINTVAIKYSILSADVDSISGDHDSVVLDVEEKKTKWIRVEHQTLGEVADGYIIYSNTPDQTLIEVSGAASEISKVSYAKVSLDVTGATSNMSANVEIELYDKEDKLVDQTNIKKNVDQIHMSVEILATKDVPVKVRTTGTPAEGYLPTGEITCSIPSVSLAASKYLLSTVTAVEIPAEEVDITGATSDYTVKIDLQDYVKSPLRFVNRTESMIATIVVKIAPVEEKNISIPAENVRISGCPEGVTISAEEGIREYTFRLAGLEQVLTAVRGSSLYVTADLQEYMKEGNLKELKSGTIEVPLYLEDTQDYKVLVSPKAVLTVKENE